MKGHLFILSGPSGVGKNAVEKLLRKQLPDLHRLVTTTTRPRRSNEQDGVDYNFVTKHHFQEMIDAGAFLEWAVVHDHLYGSPKQAAHDVLEKGKNILLIIDVQGAINIKQTMPEAQLIFLEPESLEQIRQRIANRPNIDEAELEIRLKSAEKELALRDYYDYSVLNKEGKLRVTAEEVAKIIRSKTAES